MKASLRMPLLLAAAAVVGVGAVTSCASAGGAGGSAAPDSWHDVMEDVVDPVYDELTGLVEGSAVDAAAVALRARQLASAFALGYGRLELDDIEDFAGRARRAEQWMLEVASLAESGKLDAVQRLVASGYDTHCVACHDAPKKKK